MHAENDGQLFIWLTLDKVLEQTMGEERNSRRKMDLKFETTAKDNKTFRFSFQRDI